MANTSNTHTAQRPLIVSVRSKLALQFAESYRQAGIAGQSVRPILAAIIGGVAGALGGEK